MKAYWYPHKYNVGDTLTPHVIKHFLPKVKIEWVQEVEKGKLLGIGSIMRVLKAGDSVWGSGIMRETDQFPQAKDCKFYAVRGKLTRDILMKFGAEVPEIYGDPALLLPLIHSPKHIKKKYKVGYIPHYVDKTILTNKFKFDGTNTIIDVATPWKKFIDEVLECESIVSSSLHGIVIAEAYGIPATWAEYSNKVIGNGFKFRDYLTGTGREIQGLGAFPPIDPDKLAHIQGQLLGALEMWASRNYHENQ